MDGNRIDHWARRLGGVPRRRALAALGAGLLLGRRGTVQAAAASKKHRKHKKPCPTCPTCRAGEDFCAGNGTPPCGSGCRCARHLVGGATGCVVFTGTIQCGDCERDADCAAFGAGAFCVDGSGAFCCDTPGRGFCAAACKT